MGVNQLEEWCHVFRVQDNGAIIKVSQGLALCALAVVTWLSSCSGHGSRLWERLDLFQEVEQSEAGEKREKGQP